MILNPGWYVFQTGRIYSVKYKFENNKPCKQKAMH